LNAILDAMVENKAQSAAISAEPESLGMMANNYSVFPPAPITVEQPCPLRS
jgi:hypothetical protein